MKNEVIIARRPTIWDRVNIITSISNGIEPLHSNKYYTRNKIINNKMITAQVVLINPEGLVLGVSRKDDHTSMGLAGGKMEDIDNDDPKNTAIRETKEETGLDISNLRLIFAIHKGGNMGYTYLADYSGEINHNEPHVVKWLPFQTLVRGSFGRYNQFGYGYCSNWQER